MPDMGVSETDARDMIRRRLIEDNERYTMFKASDPALVDGLVFVKATKGQVRLKTPPEPRPEFARVLDDYVLDPGLV